ncbi:TRAP transporter substrate-binding protein [Marinivivus vitaminiproducens]|uniref:TRAP transporter substrate-binding protein n=1 Tax=Marinivivus vitaminiproducens TaxID=3035935 RepID=UPI0027A173D0|nr:TRAP transporter substrate-binding protein [Geminicoccaceae bacterium SCSIO 64248]
MRHLSATMTYGAAMACMIALSSPGLAQTTLRMGHDQPDVHGYQEVGNFFNERFRQEMQGEYDVRIFPGAQLGNEMAMLDSVVAGNLDMSIASAANASTFLPELGLFSVGYIFSDVDHFRRVLNDEAFNAMIDDIVASKDLGIRRLATFTAGVRNLYNTEGPVTSPDDISQMKMRVMASPVETRVWTDLGTLPVSIPFGDVYTGMQTGLVQGAENAAAVYASNKHYEVAPFYSLTGHQWLVAFLFINEDRFESFPPDVQEHILAIGKAASDHVLDYVLESDADFIAKMQAEYGVKVNEVDSGPFVERLGSTQDDVAADLGVEPLLARIRELK